MADQTAQAKHDSSGPTASKQTVVGLNTSLVGRAIVVEALPAVSAAVLLS
jgi:hypothetical protein